MQLRKSTPAAALLLFISITVDAQWNLTGNSGTSSLSNFVGTTDFVDLKFRTNNSVRMVIGRSGNVSVGTSASTLANFTTAGAVGNTTAIFGTGATGISMQQSYPGISFNSYYNGGYKALGAGYGANFTLDPSNGKLHYRAISNGAGAGSAQTYTTPLVITSGGTVGIGNTSPDNTVDLHVGTTTGARLKIGDQSQLQDNGNMRLAVTSTFEPTADNAYHLGGSSTRWVDVWSADGSINTSDRRDKTNIRDIRYGLNEVMKLHPVMFTWKDAPERGEKIGLIAQELQAVIKEAVATRTFTTDLAGNKTVTENERLGVYYTDLTAVMVKAIQEQQQEITAKDTKIRALEDQLKNISDRLDRMEQSIHSTSTNSLTNSTEARLYQNTPNPFSDISVIRFYVPVKSRTAALKIFSADGREVNTFRSVTKGENKIEIAAGALPAGIYNYSLFIDGQLASSKQMVLVQ